MSTVAFPIRLVRKIVRENVRGIVRDSVRERVCEQRHERRRKKLEHRVEKLPGDDGIDSYVIIASSTEQREEMEDASQIEPGRDPPRGRAVGSNCFGGGRESRDATRCDAMRRPSCFV